jgi:hypothetical protein
LYQRLQCRDNYFFKIKFVFFHYLLLSASWNDNDLPLYISQQLRYMNWNDALNGLWINLKVSLIRLFRNMSIPTTFRLFRVLTSEMFGRRLPVFMLLLWQRQYIISKLNLFSFIICYCQHHEMITISLYIFLISDR